MRRAWPLERVLFALAGSMTIRRLLDEMLAEPAEAAAHRLRAARARRRYLEEECPPCPHPATR